MKIRKFSLPAALTVFILILLYSLDQVLPFFEIKTYNTMLNYIIMQKNGKNTVIITNSMAVTLPYSHESIPTDQFTFTTHVKIMPFSSKNIRIKADDYLYSLTVDDMPVPLNQISESQRWDYNNGFTVNLGHYLTNGENKMEFIISDKNKGRYGLTVESKPCIQNPYSLIFITIILILLGFSGYFILSSFIKDKVLIWIVFAGIALHFHYFGYTDYNVRTYDILEGQTGHINYIEYVVDNLSIPKPDKGWEYHQPPLYYVTSAVFYKIGQLIKVNNIYRLLQALSLFYFIGFLLFGTLIVLRLYGNTILFYLGVLLLFFWPSGFIHAVRIGNDVLIYFLSAGGIYFLQKYYLDNDCKAFYFFLVFAFLAILTKSNAVILYGIMFLFLLAEAFKAGFDLKKFWLKKAGILFTVFFIGFMIHASGNYYYAIKEGRHDWYMAAFLNNPQQVNSGLLVGNSFGNYLYFDMKNYLTEPFTSTWQDQYGRQYFWNFFLKSSLFGEFSFEGKYIRTLAMIMSLLLLSMVITVIFGLIVYIRRWFLSGNIISNWLMMPVENKNFIKGGSKNSTLQKFKKIEANNSALWALPCCPKWAVFRRALNKEWGKINRNVNNFKHGYLEIPKKRLKNLSVMFITLLISVLLMVIFRMQISFSPLADFRYIYPAILPFISFYLFTIRQMRESGHQFLVMILFYQGIIFALSSGLFFLGMLRI